VFEFGFWELILILVLVLVVAGPERLPGIVRTVGRWAGRAKALAGQLKDEFEREVHADDLKRAMREAEDAARSMERDLETTACAQVQGPRDTAAPSPARPASTDPAREPPRDG
jgi:sec-independent protein translocase protein TatB